MLDPLNQKKKSKLAVIVSDIRINEGGELGRDLQQLNK